MPPIKMLRACHSNQPAWIFGKGPGLDKFDMSQAGALRICINESLLRVPGATYFFAHDEKPMQHVTQHWPEACCAVLEASRAAFALRSGVPENNIFVYKKCQGDWSVLEWTAEQIADRNSLFGLTGTVHSALHFCRLIGVSKLHLVGMEGKGGYAPSLGLSLPRGGGRHEVIQRHMVKVAAALGFDVSLDE